MDLFFNYVKNECKDRCEIRNDYKFIPTPSILLNKSIFAKKWIIINESIMDVYENNLKECLKEVYEEVYECECLETNPIKFNYATQFFSEFIEKILNDDCDDDDCHNDYIKDIRQNHRENVKQYVLHNEMNCWFNDDNKFDMGYSYDHEINQNILSKDWYCFLIFKDDGNHMHYWLINTNSTCSLFEYVIECGHSQEISSDIYHFSQMDDKMDKIKEINEW